MTDANYKYIIIHAQLYDLVLPPSITLCKVSAFYYSIQKSFFFVRLVYCKLCVFHVPCFFQKGLCIAFQKVAEIAEQSIPLHSMTHEMVLAKG